METLVGLAEGIGKVNMRHKVIPEDGLLACFIYEEMISTLSGYSFLDMEPMFGKPGIQFGELLDDQIDRRMEVFQSELRHYIMTYVDADPEEWVNTE